MPASSEAAALCVPNQSLNTTPSKPRSSRSTPRSSGPLSQAYVPLIRLYDDITDRTPASTAASNGTRYSSRSVRSSTSLEIVIRSNSVSLAMKCLMHAATRSDCRPRT